MAKVDFIKTENIEICYVNTEQSPTQVIRHKIFKYERRSLADNLEFSELCTYQYTNENATYERLTWERIFVPSYKESLFKLVCDSMKGLS